jgi:hypothetical protein
LSIISSITFSYTIRITPETSVNNKTLENENLVETVLVAISFQPAKVLQVLNCNDIFTDNFLKYPLLPIKFLTQNLIGINSNEKVMV